LFDESWRYDTLCNAVLRWCGTFSEQKTISILVSVVSGVYYAVTTVLMVLGRIEFVQITPEDRMSLHPVNWLKQILFTTFVRLPTKDGMSIQS
jgi:hypothetical protein